MAEFNLTGRVVDEWVGRDADARPPKSVIDRLFLRQNGRCALTGRKMLPGDEKHCDHIVPLKDGGLNVESNLQLVLAVPHREKTSTENKARAKERRQRLKHYGLWPKSRTQLKGRKFAKTRSIGDRDD